MPSAPKILFLLQGEYKVEICVEHVTGEEKYDWEILRVDVMVSSNYVGKVCCVVLNGFFMEGLCLYL